MTELNQLFLTQFTLTPTPGVRLIIIVTYAFIGIAMSWPEARDKNVWKYLAGGIALFGGVVVLAQGAPIKTALEAAIIGLIIVTYAWAVIKIIMVCIQKPDYNSWKCGLVRGSATLGAGAIANILFVLLCPDCALFLLDTIFVAAVVSSGLFVVAMIIIWTAVHMIQKWVLILTNKKQEPEGRPRYSQLI
jgi:ABC-type transport system involved in multi-copper enzyme maturation permease subunit